MGSSVGGGEGFSDETAACDIETLAGEEGMCCVSTYPQGVALIFPPFDPG